MDEAGYTMMDWNMDSSDSSRPNVPADEIVAKVKGSSLKHEVVLLMHDGTGHGQTVQALPEIIAYFKKQGYEFAPLTPKVKPVQSPISSKKSKPSYSFEQFTQQENRVKQVILDRQQQALEVAKALEAKKVQEAEKAEKALEAEKELEAKRNANLPLPAKQPSVPVRLPTGANLLGVYAVLLDEKAQLPD
ncbi:unnamed protein product [Aphanomyces euteiches]